MSVQLSAMSLINVSIISRAMSRITAAGKGSGPTHPRQSTPGLMLIAQSESAPCVGNPSSDCRSAEIDSEPLPHPVWDRRLGTRLASKAPLQLDQDVAKSAFDQQLCVAQDPIAGGDARPAEAGDSDLEPQLLVEVRRLTVTEPCFGDHEVDAPVDDRLVATQRRPKQLGNGDVEVGEKVGVEHDALRVALPVADAQLAGEGGRHTCAGYILPCHGVTSLGRTLGGLARLSDRLRTLPVTHFYW